MRRTHLDPRAFGTNTRDMLAHHYATEGYSLRSVARMLGLFEREVPEAIARGRRALERQRGPGE